MSSEDALAGLCIPGQVPGSGHSGVTPKALHQHPCFFPPVLGVLRAGGSVIDDGKDNDTRKYLKRQ